MQLMKSKLKAFFVHFGISLVIGVLVVFLVGGVWYPYPFHILSGGWQLLILALVVDVVVGPMLTALVYNPRKGRLEKVSEFVVIGFLQISALIYGVWSIFEARPVHVVFEYDRFRVVHANDVPENLLPMTPEGIKAFPVTGPTWLGLRPLEGKEKFDYTMQALDGVAVAARPELWNSYEKSTSAVLAAAKPLDDLNMRFPKKQNSIKEAVRDSKRTMVELRYLPIQGRKMEVWTVLLDAATAQPVAYVDVDSF
jgi:hypothetical protein